MYRMQWSYQDLSMCPADVLTALIDIMQKDTKGH
jgi:hypothetical protein